MHVQFGVISDMHSERRVTLMKTVRNTAQRAQRSRRNLAKGYLAAFVLATALLVASTASALAASDKAGCVGQFSTFFAHGGLGTHRSEVATDFAHNARPAGANVYRHVAVLHGTLEECFEQT
jgi:hypothetical protein